jgi:hypothetical protein
MGGMEGFGSLGDPFAPDPDADERTRKRRLHEYAKIADRYGGGNKVIVGEIVDVREVFADCRVCVVIEYPVNEDDFTGTKKADGWLEAPDTVGLAAIAGRVYGNRTAAIDRKTGQILEVSSEIY